MVRRMTYQEMNELHRDGKITELVKGVFYNHPAPADPHQIIVGNLVEIIGMFIKHRKLGEYRIAPYDVIFSNEDVFQPDFLFISKKEIKNIEYRGFTGIPALVIEVISKSDEKHDTVTKKMIYATYQVKNIWYIFPEKKTVEVHKLKGTKYLLRSTYSVYDTFTFPLFPKLKIQCRKIFEGVKNYYF